MSAAGSGGHSVLLTYAFYSVPLVVPKSGVLESRGPGRVHSHVKEMSDGPVAVLPGVSCCLDQHTLWIHCADRSQGDKDDTHAHRELCFLDMQGSPIRRCWGNAAGAEWGCSISGDRDLEVTSVNDAFQQLWVQPPQISEPKEVENPRVRLGKTGCKESWSLARAPTGELRKIPWEMWGSAVFSS